MSAGQPLTAVQCIFSGIITENIPRTHRSESRRMIERMIVAIADSAGADVWDN